MPMVAWYILSKESYIKRVIRDVLPTTFAMSWSFPDFTRRQSYHSVHPRRLACHRVSDGLFVCLKGRRLRAAYLNFFSGFEYDPTVDCVAMPFH